MRACRVKTKLKERETGTLWQPLTAMTYQFRYLAPLIHQHPGPGTCPPANRFSACWLLRGCTGSARHQRPLLLWLPASYLQSEFSQTAKPTCPVTNSISKEPGTPCDNKVRLLRERLQKSYQKADEKSQRQHPVYAPGSSPGICPANPHQNAN